MNEENRKNKARSEEIYSDEMRRLLKKKPKRKVLRLFGAAEDGEPIQNNDSYQKKEDAISRDRKKAGHGGG